MPVRREIALRSLLTIADHRMPGLQRKLSVDPQLPASAPDVAPEMKSDSSETMQRTMAATSAGTPSRPTGIRRRSTTASAPDAKGLCSTVMIRIENDPSYCAV